MRLVRKLVTPPQRCAHKFTYYGHLVEVWGCVPGYMGVTVYDGRKEDDIIMSFDLDNRFGSVEVGFGIKVEDDSVPRYNVDAALALSLIYGKEFNPYRD